MVKGGLALPGEERRDLDSSFDDVDKAFWVALGNHQPEGVNFNETYTPVRRADTFCLLVAKASALQCLLPQCNILTVFLYGPIKEKVYTCQVQGFKDKNEEELLIELN